MDSLHSEELPEIGFPDTDATVAAAAAQQIQHETASRKKLKKQRRSHRKQQQQQFLHAYYLEHCDDDNMQYNYVHSKIKDKLVWYRDVEKLLPSTIPGQFIYGLLNLMFSSDLYYAFHRYSFNENNSKHSTGFSTEHRMDDFFTSRRVLSIQRTIPDLFPSKLWYKIIQYEPTPYKSMCFYQHVRQSDADKIYKLPVIFGYVEGILLVAVSFLFCIDYAADDNVKFMRFPIGSNAGSVTSLLFDSQSHFTLNMMSFLLLIIGLLHILCTLIVWRITWFLHYKIYDYKKRIFHYLSRRRRKEMEFIEKFHDGNRRKIKKENKYRLYYKIEPNSYLFYKRNGELFISLLKWLNVVEYEQNLDFLITSKRNWIVITFALHKYIALVVYALIMMFGLTWITCSICVLLFISYWIHCIELYQSDHHNVESKANQDFISNSNLSICSTLMSIMKILLWPGVLVYAVLAYVVYIALYQTDYFIVIWFGISPIWLIVYSVLTRGYRRIYIFNGLAMFMLYWLTATCYLFRYNQWQQLATYSTATVLSAFAALCNLSIQCETHRGMLFPQMSQQFKLNEGAQHKFGLSVTGAKIYTFVQYAAMYFSKHDNSKPANSKQPESPTDAYRNASDFAMHPAIAKIKQFAFTIFNKWYIQRPLDALKVPQPRFPFAKPKE